MNKQDITELGSHSVRRTAYRLAGFAFALAIVKVPFERISIESLWSEPHDGSNGVRGYDGTPEQIAFAYIVGECAANFSGAARDTEPQEKQPPDLASIEDFRQGIVGFAERSIGPISVIAETLLATGRLSEADIYRIIVPAMKRAIA